MQGAGVLLPGLRGSILQRAQVVVGAARLGGRPCNAVTWGAARSWPRSPQLTNLPCQACRRACSAARAPRLLLCRTPPGPSSRLPPRVPVQSGPQDLSPPLRLGTAVPLPWESRAKEMPPKPVVWQARRQQQARTPMGPLWPLGFMLLLFTGRLCAHGFSSCTESL